MYQYLHHDGRTGYGSTPDEAIRSGGGPAIGFIISHLAEINWTWAPGWETKPIGSCLRSGHLTRNGSTIGTIWEVRA